MRRDLDMAAMAVSYRDGETPASIAGDHGCSITTVISRLRRAGVVIRTLSAARKRAWADPEARAKMSEARKRAWADPAVRAKMSEARKRALADPAVRAKMSAARKRAWAQKGRLVVPPEHRLYFNKLCRVLGRAAAEAELVSLTAERLEIPPKPSESAA